MTARDRAKLLKIDTELLDLEYEIDTAREIEAATGKTTLLVSKTLQYKYDRLLKMRSNLERSVSNRLSRQETYSITLTDRKRACEIAAKEVTDILTQLTNLTANAAFTNDVAKYQSTASDLRMALRSAKTILVNKERALDNWLAKSEIDLPAKRDYVPRGDDYQPKADARVLAAMRENELAKPEAQPRFDITQTEDFYKSPITAIPYDLLASSPKPVEDGDTITFIPDPDVEAEEIRQLEEMHETKYQPSMID